jgi:hypothetical protein
MKRCLSTGNLSTNDPFVSVGLNKKAKKQRQKGQKDISATQPLTVTVDDCALMSAAVMDTVIESVINPSLILNPSAVNLCECDKLKVEMSSLIKTIAQLSAKVEFLMSFLGLESDNEPSDRSQHPQGHSVSSNSNRPSDGNSAASSGSNGSRNNLPSYANAARSKPTQLSTQMRQAVMSAVYVDLHSKSARANNIVVNGVPKMNEMDDKSLVMELCEKEFNLQPVIKLCKRLGKPVTNKTQSLLVTLDSTDHAKTILSDAKLLRKSHNDFVRENVFINADLTQAEATVAYEERCRRRRQREVRANYQHQQHQPQQQQQQHTMGSMGTHPPAPAGVSHSKLDATVQVFQPTATSGRPASSSHLPALSHGPVV